MGFVAKMLGWQTLALVLASLTVERGKKPASMEEGRKLAVIDKDNEQSPEILEGCE